MRQLGFTVIELMVAVMVLAILTVIAVPSFQATITSNRLNTSIGELTAALSLARAEAIRRGQRVTICATADGTSCDAGNNWTAGWLVFVDTNKNGAYNAGEPKLREQIPGIGGGANFNLRASSNINSGLSYVPTGLASSEGTFRVCASNTNFTENSRDVVVNLPGRAITRRQADSGCTSAIPND